MAWVLPRSPWSSSWGRATCVASGPRSASWTTRTCKVCKPWPGGSRSCLDADPMTPDLPTQTRAVEEARRRLEPFFSQVARVLVGQRLLVDRLLVGLLTG